MADNTENIEEWVPMSEATFTLKTEGMSVSASKLSRLATSKKIKTLKDPLDERVRLVDLNELRALFKSSRRSR